MMPGSRSPGIVTPERSIDVPSLADLARDLQTGLAGSVGAGTPLGVWVEDPVDFAACIMAALELGAEAFIVLPGASPDRVAELSAIEGGSAVLCDTTRAARLAGLRRRACGPGLVLVETAAVTPAGVAVDHGDPGGVHFYTSGTDGRPKGVRRSTQSLRLEEATVGGHLGMGPGCTVLSSVPVTHGYGYTAGLFAPLTFGGTAVVAQPRLAASLASVVAEHQPDIVVAVPAQYAAWATLRRPYDGPLPRLWLCGGAPLPAAVRRKFQQAWGSVIAEQYGMTEVGAVSVDLDGAETLGRPYPGVTVTIDTGGTSDEVGEVVVDAPYGPRGYLGDPGSSSAAGSFTPDGFRSGDSGWFDADGRLHLVGRRAHQLNVRGRQVDPTEIERALWTVGGMREVAVMGVDRTAGDQWIAAFVVCTDDVTDEALHGATSSLDTYKRPQRLMRLAALPKTATGTDFDALRALLHSTPLC